MALMLPQSSPLQVSIIVQYPKRDAPRLTAFTKKEEISQKEGNNLG
jgi:hypothetical protein